MAYAEKHGSSLVIGRYQVLNRSAQCGSAAHFLTAANPDRSSGRNFRNGEIIFFQKGQVFKIFDPVQRNAAAFFRVNSVFEQIPPGLISVNWSGEFGVDLYIFLKRKEAAW